MPAALRTSPSWLSSVFSLLDSLLDSKLDSNFLAAIPVTAPTDQSLPTSQLINLPSYQSPRAEAINGDAPCDNGRCDPKLIVGSEIVRELPRPSSIETFSD